MRKFGLIGFPLTHSFSASYFEEKFILEKINDCLYELFPLEKIEELTSLLQNQPALCGLNVTIPYKEAVIPYLDLISPEAREIGAINCIKIMDGKLHGFNTDVYGFEKSADALFSKEPLQAFVLGSGGASKAVQFCLKRMKVPFVTVSRNQAAGSSYSAIESQMGEHNVFINTTPLGMFPHTQFAPDIPYHLLTADDVLIDLIYNPEETLFLKKGKEAGCRIKNGREMLQLQAEKSWEIWNKPSI
ncbi:MAG: shikimate dehydrogenase [Bacteroidetes bacterium]|nr:shikimate dehydrogenase [Bacteroidota bacterium]